MPNRQKSRGGPGQGRHQCLRYTRIPKKTYDSYGYLSKTYEYAYTLRIRLLAVLLCVTYDSHSDWPGSKRRTHACAQTSVRTPLCWLVDTTPGPHVMPAAAGRRCSVLQVDASLWHYKRGQNIRLASGQTYSPTRILKKRILCRIVYLKH